MNIIIIIIIIIINYTMKLSTSVANTLFKYGKIQMLYRRNIQNIANVPLTPSSAVLVTRLDDNDIVHVEFNRPDKLNALNIDLFNGIAEVALKLAADKSVRCVILSGKGKAFCTGLDVNSVATNPLQAAKLLEKPAGTNISNLAQDVGYLWRKIPCPVIAAVHGMCFGGGMQIALGADFRLVSPDCKVSIMEAKWGMIPDMSAAVTLRELVRIDIAKELTMTGRVISGEEAARIGLMTRCSDDPFSSALQLAREICSRSPDSVAATKKLFQESWYSTEEQALHLETSLQKKILGSYNQLAAAGRNTGVSMPYKKRMDFDKTDS
jgi:enoyl-CoA hydratase/carnithine racemase